MDINNKVIGFGGRVMGDGKPKYLNSPETKLFDKSKNLYGLNVARSSRKKEIILCEGYMDVISMHQAGFTNAVASLGTALTSGLLRSRHVPFRTGGNGTAASSGTDQRNRQHAASVRERPGSPSRIECAECTTVCTTFESENMKGNKNVCEVLPIGKVPEKPEVTGYTGI